MKRALMGILALTLNACATIEVAKEEVTNPAGATRFDREVWKHPHRKVVSTPERRHIDLSYLGGSKIIVANDEEAKKLLEEEGKEKNESVAASTP